MIRISRSVGALMRCSLRQFCPLIVLAAPVILAASASASEPGPLYKLTKAVALGAPDRWDCVVFDAGSQRVYVAHGDQVTVVDAIEGKVIGNVGPFPGGTHGVGIATAAKRGYTNDGKAGTAISFDLTTLKIQKTTKADDDADGIVVDPVTGHVFVINGDPGTVTVIDPQRDTAIAKIEAGAKLEFGVAGANGKIYVNGEKNKEIVRIDTATNKIDAHWPMPNCTSPHGIAYDAAAHRIFSTCANASMTVLNADSGEVVASLTIGRGTDGAGYDPVRKRAFSSNGADGTLSVISETDPQKFVVADTVKTAITGRTMDVDPKSGRIFIAAADVDPSSNGRPRAMPGTLKLLFFDPAP